jgi:hypothetical protein
VNILPEPPVRIGVPEPSSHVVVEVNFAPTAESPLLDWIRNAVRPPRNPVRTVQDDECWVLVKGWHDQGGVEGVYGPYTEDFADWLLGHLLECSSCNWTKAKLSTGPET